MRTKPVWYINYNTDNTEGRGPCYDATPCSNPVTAKRLARKKGVQGGNAHVSKGLGIKHEGAWYYKGPLEGASKDDEADIKELEKQERSRYLLDQALGRPLTAGEILEIRV